LHLNLLICVAVPIHDADKSGCVLADSALIQRPVRILEIGGLGLAPENKRSLSSQVKRRSNLANNRTANSACFLMFDLGG
jgi:hypothetical protein